MKKVIYLLACVAFLGCYSCSDDDDGLKMQDISVEFAVSDAGMDGTALEQAVVILQLQLMGGGSRTGRRAPARSKAADQRLIPGKGGAGLIG